MLCLSRGVGPFAKLAELLDCCLTNAVSSLTLQ